MKYYSKSPQEFKHDQEQAQQEYKVKRKKSFILQIAQMWLLVGIIFLIMKTPGVINMRSQKNTESVTKTTETVNRSVVWKNLALISECHPGKSCELIIRKQNNNSKAMDWKGSFYWHAKNIESGETIARAFELAPHQFNDSKDYKYTLPINESETSISVEVHFLNQKNEEEFMMQVYP